MNEATTEFAEFYFTVKERRDGTPFILLESRSGLLASLGNGFLSLQLHGGVSLDEATHLTKVLNSYVAGLSHTTFTS